MFRTDCVDRNGTHVLDHTVIRIIQHKGVHCYAMHTFPSILYLLIRQCLKDTFLLCVQYYALKYLMLQNCPILVILTVGKYFVSLQRLHCLKYIYIKLSYIFNSTN